MSKMSTISAQKLADNLAEIETMARELEDYIIDNEVYRTVLVSTGSGNRKIEMSGGDLLARINRLKEQRDKLPPAQQERVDNLDADIRKTIYSLRTRFHELLRRELKSRHDQLDWNVDVRRVHEEEDPDAAEVHNRHRIAAIQQELRT